MGLLTFLAIASIHAQVAQPVLWLAPSGQVEVAGRPVSARITPGASRIRLAGGYAYSFNGVHGGILLEDLPALRLTGSMTVSGWINLRSYVNDGPGAQVLFRGDDRNGYDAYSLCIHSDGTICFAIWDGENRGWGIGGEIPLNHWMHVLASFNAQNGELQLWLNHERVAYARTSRRPVEMLDSRFAPGIGIGNVQNDHGPHNQPLNGMLADLRLYNRVYEPDDVDNSISPGDDNPPLSDRSAKPTVQ